MKFSTFRDGDGFAFGVVEDDAIAVLGGTVGYRWTSLQHYLAAGATQETARDVGRAARKLLTEVSFAPVIADPGAIFCVGLNYARHVAEMGREPPSHPAIFIRMARTQVGHGEPMVLPAVSDKFDFEGELAVIIGRGGRYIRARDALGHVAGYACYNDGSLRDFQRHTMQFTPGKNFWATGAFGPCLVTPEEFGEVATHTVTTRLNGVVMQQASFADFIFDVPTLIEYLSSFTELRCGDVIITGTPGGVGAARTPPVFMKPGDAVEVEIDGIGILRNRIVAEADVEVPGVVGAAA